MNNSITKKLLELGFTVDENYLRTGTKGYVYRTSREDRNRFVHDFVYYEGENQFYINVHKTSATHTISEENLLRDHNNLNTQAKEKWLEIKGKLKKYVFNVYYTQ